MNKLDACKILGISGEINLKSVKTAYFKACKTYHPDKNPAGLEMMKAVNEAYASLKTIDFSQPFNFDPSQSVRDYGEALNTAILATQNLPGVDLELCGAWLWLSGNTREFKTEIKTAGFRWAPKKYKWYFRPADYKSRSRGKYTMDEIRDKYGSSCVKPERRDALDEIA